MEEEQGQNRKKEIKPDFYHEKIRHQLLLFGSDRCIEFLNAPEAWLKNVDGYLNLNKEEQQKVIEQCKDELYRRLPLCLSFAQCIDLLRLKAEAENTALYYNEEDYRSPVYDWIKSLWKASGEDAAKIQKVVERNLYDRLKIGAYPKNAEIYHGPRNKSLATYHLEYIANAILSEPDTVNFLQKRNPILIEINGKIFNLTAILEAKPDFEQLKFSQRVLRGYEYLFADHEHAYKEAKRLKELYPNDKLSQAEIMALVEWTSGPTYLLNQLLRDKLFERFGEDEKSKRLILTICIASQALSRIPETAEKLFPDSVGKTFRVEKYNLALSLQRDEAVKTRKLLSSEGFIASAGGDYFSSNFRGRVGVVYERVWGSSLGKDVGKYSLFGWREREVLYPPNTEFLYTDKRMGLGPFTVGGYLAHAIPIRSINAEVLGEQPLYVHLFTLQDLQEIQSEYERLSEMDLNDRLLGVESVTSHEHAKSQIKNTLQFLSGIIGKLEHEKPKLQHGAVRILFDTVDNSKKQKVLQGVINETKAFLKEGVDEDGKIDSVKLQNLLDVVQNAIAENKKLGEEARVKSAPGKTGNLLENVFEQLKSLQPATAQSEVHYVSPPRK